MIRIKLRRLLEEKAFKERRRIQWSEVVAATGISESTLRRMANVPGSNVEMDAIDALCGYLKCQPGDLLEHVAQRRSRR